MFKKKPIKFTIPAEKMTAPAGSEKMKIVPLKKAKASNLKKRKNA